MFSWERGDDDRAVCPVLSSNATSCSWCERPADGSWRWRCCIQRLAGSAFAHGPKGLAACYEMTGLCRSSTMSEVPAAPRQLLAMINDPPYLAFWGRASPGTAGRRALLNHTIVRSWPIRAPPRLQDRTSRLPTGVPLDIMQAKAIKLSSPLARRDTVAPPTAGHDRDDDIVERALAILDEELRSWVKTRHRGHASGAEGVLARHEQSGDVS
jgi:hypothetical protein